uniref:Uncharacterized protein n=1 Tax=Anopheles dirus TaxID=7168 RepID=A0A182N372_9DIPT
FGKNFRAPPDKNVDYGSRNGPDSAARAHNHTLQLYTSILLHQPESRACVCSGQNSFGNDANRTNVPTSPTHHAATSERQQHGGTRKKHAYTINLLDPG